MTTGHTKLLFSWDDVDSLPDLRRLRLVLDWLPDEPVIEALRAGRRRGRDDYPVEAMWRTLVAGAVFQHASIESLLREPGRNPGLLSVCGFNPLPRQGKPRRAVRAGPGTGAAAVVELPALARSPVSRAWNFTRFLEAVESVESEKGGVVCRCPATGVERPMAFQGFEADRCTPEYRCPAAAHDRTCRGRAVCHRQAGCDAGDHGRVVRIGLDKVDRRVFTPTPHGSPSWRRGCKRRAALERTDARLDNDFGFERHCIRGHAAMKTRVGLALAIMMALALGHVREGRPGRMRSLVGEVPLLDTG